LKERLTAIATASRNANLVYMSVLEFGVEVDLNEIVLIRGPGDGIGAHPAQAGPDTRRQGEIAADDVALEVGAGEAAAEIGVGETIDRGVDWTYGSSG